MGFITWIVLGALAGWLAGKFMNTGKMGLLTNIIVGVIGAFVGGFVVSLFGGQGVSGFNIWSLLVALLGSVLFLWVAKKIRK